MVSDGPNDNLNSTKLLLICALLSGSGAGLVGIAEGFGAKPQSTGETPRYAGIQAELTITRAAIQRANEDIAELAGRIKALEHDMREIELFHARGSQ